MIVPLLVGWASTSSPRPGTGFLRAVRELYEGNLERIRGLD